MYLQVLQPPADAFWKPPKELHCILLHLLKAIQEHYIKNIPHDEESVAFVIFNVKGKDLMAIDSPNDFADDPVGEKERVYAEYEKLDLSTEPFKQVQYFIPYYSSTTEKRSTYLSKDDVNNYLEDGKLHKFKYSYACAISS